MLAMEDIHSLTKKASTANIFKISLLHPSTSCNYGQLFSYLLLRRRKKNTIREHGTLYMEVCLPISVLLFEVPLTRFQGNPEDSAEK